MYKGFWGLLALAIVAGLGVGGLLGAVIGGSPAGGPGVATAGAARSGNGTTAAAAGSAGGTGADAAALAGRRPTVGTVERIDGRQVAVKTENGSVQVALTDQTTYRKLATGVVGDLKPGDVVVARGEAAGEGALVARSLQVVPTGAGPLALAGGGGGPSPSGGNGPSQGGAGAGRRPGGERGAVSGTIQSIEGKNVTLTTATGPLKLTVAEGAEIRRLAGAGREDLKAGQTVTVLGQGGAGGSAEGALTAAAITITGD